MSPAYLLRTDADMPVEELMQSYFWRWCIEVNLKEEKQLSGAGQELMLSAAGRFFLLQGDISATPGENVHTDNVNSEGPNIYRVKLKMSE